MLSIPYSKEVFSYRVGVAENVGDAITYLILTLDYQIIARPNLHPAYHPEHQNYCQVEGEYAEDLRPPAAMAQAEEIIDNKNSTLFMLTVDPNNIVEFQFIKKHNDFLHKAKVIELLKNGFNI